MLHSETIGASALAASGIVIAFGLLQLLLRWATGRKRAPYPPGPKGAPLVGNMFDFPSINAADCYMDWGKKYNSSIVHASALGNHVIILNSLSDAEELLERRSSLYSDRIEMPIVKLLDLDDNMGFMHQGPQWKRQRRLAQQYFHLDTVSTAHHPIQLRRVHVLLQALLQTPDDFFNHIKVVSVSIPFASIYGYDIASDLTDPFIKGVGRALELGDPLLTPFSTLVNIIPSLSNIPPWVPGATTQKIAAEHRQVVNKLKTEPMKVVKEAMTRGISMPSVFSDFIASRSGTAQYEEEEALLGSLALTIYGGTTGTSISIISTVFYLLAAHPDVQKRGQEEIYRVVGTDRLPGFEDRTSLPYIDAIYHEAMRWRPPTMLGIPHCLREDDHYKGYLIPKGSAIFANVWAMTRDENVYEDPYMFKPERYLDVNGELIKDRRVLAYGFGRRLCIGRQVASSTLWLVIASLLCTFDISKKKDSSGRELEISNEYEDIGLVCQKKPFFCSITPRFDRTKSLIGDAVAAEKVGAA